MKSDASLQGSASVLIILIFLSMSIFGVLSMVSAYSDLKLADKSARWVTEYYALDAEAERLVLEVHTALSGCAAQGDYLTNAKEALTYAGWEFYEHEDGGLLTWRTVTHGEEGRRQNLLVELLLYQTPDAARRRFFEVTRWTQWQEPFTYEDEGIGVWDGL